jgi:FMN phosphatase YigB (HAD superfamily)
MIDFYHLPSSVQLPEFSKVWGDIFTPAPPEIEYILDRLRPDVVAAIASNTEVLHWPFIERLPTVQRFIGVPNRDVVCSFDVGFEKPDVQFFEKALERIGATRPDEVLFIDDVPENVRAFQLMGGKGCVFDLTKNAPRELEDILALHNLLTV